MDLKHNYSGLQEPTHLADFLDTYPNAVVDMAARMSNLQYQSNRDREKVLDVMGKAAAKIQQQVRL